LANYANLVQGNYGSTTTGTASRGGLGLAGNLGQLGGSVAALGSIFGGGSDT
jgi:hypothetical protein